MEDKKKVEGSSSKGVPQQAGHHQAAEATAVTLVELREQRTLDYLEHALSVDDPLSANVGAVSADLMFFAAQMRRIIAPALEKLPAEPSALAHLVPAVESHGRVARQIERLAALLERLNRRQEAAKKTVAALARNAGIELGES